MLMANVTYGARKSGNANEIKQRDGNRFFGCSGLGNSFNLDGHSVVEFINYESEIACITALYLKPFYFQIISLFNSIIL